MRFHTNLPVSNIEQTTRFYSTLFGVPPVKRKSDYVKFLPATGGLNVAFHENRAASARFQELHLGFELPDQSSLDEVYQRLMRAGLVSEERETSVCCYANQDKFWVTDPDGYQWEFYVLLEDTEQKIEPKVKQKSACCAGSGCC